MGRKYKRILSVELVNRVAYFGSALLIVALLLIYKLGTLAPGIAGDEVSSYHQAASLKIILANPLNAPYKLLLLLAVNINGQPSAVALRSASVIFGLIAAFSFYLVLKHWKTRRMALLGTILFVSSSWFMHTARLATPAPAQWLLLALVAYGIWTIESRHFELSLLLGAVLLGLSLYTPGLIWFGLGLLVWQRRRLAKTFSSVSWLWQAATLALFIVLIAPLAYGFWQNNQLGITWLGLPTQLSSLNGYGKNIVNVPLQLFVRGPNDPVRWLGGLPVLDIFTSAMAILGVYAYYFKLKLDRSHLIIAVSILGSLLIALGGAVDITILLPFLYVLVAAGITLMAQQWFTVFPRNPVARGIGLVLLMSAVFLTVYYQQNSYFVAWAKSPETRAVFINQNTSDLLK